MVNTSLESTFHRLSEDVLKFEVNALNGVWEQFGKNVTVDARKMDILLHGAAAATYKCGPVDMQTING